MMTIIMKMTSLAIWTSSTYDDIMHDILHVFYTKSYKEKCKTLFI